MTNSKQMDAYKIAGDMVGLREWSDGHNPKIVKMFEDVGHSWVKDDETAWCAAFMGSILKQVGLPHTGKLNARSYLDLEGTTAVDLGDAKTGDIIILRRGPKGGWQGHVGFLVRETGEGDFVIRGGNQGNSVSDQLYRRYDEHGDRLLGFRRFASKPTNKPKPSLWQTIIKFFNRKD